MIESKLLSGWDGVVGSAALIAIIVLALSIMVGAVKARETPRHIAVIASFAILLVMLPAIIVSLWNSMTVGQHLGIAALLIAIIVLISVTHGKARNARR